MKTDTNSTDSNHTPIKTINDLFLFASPESLQKSINEVFFSYLLHNKDLFPDDFEEIVTDVRFLLLFLKQAEKKC
jgi:hypothetical protein